MDKNIMPYKEARDCMLRHIPIKLPEWEGYWVANEKGDIMEHQKNKITPATNLTYTFYDNWMVATKENCPVLRWESEQAKNKKPKAELLDFSISELTEDVVLLIKIDGGKQQFMSATELADLIGTYEVEKLINDFVIEHFTPTDLKTEYISLFDMLQTMADNLDYLENPERVELPKSLEGCDTPASMIDAVLKEGLKNNLHPLDIIKQLKQIIDNTELGNK